MIRSREVLLVDDNPADLDLTMDVLNAILPPGQVHKVIDGLQAMAFLRKEDPYSRVPRPDVVLLDLNLPGMGGLEVLREAKTDAALQTIPIVIFSTSAAQKDICRSYKLGANCYITKPGNLRDFISTITAFASFWFSCVPCTGGEDS